MAYWLFKEEPGHYPFQQLQKDGGTVWDGVRNNLALKHLRNIRRGDTVLYYHTGNETAIVGIMNIESDPYLDPKQKDPKLVVVNVTPIRALPKAVTLAQLKSDSS